LDLDLHVPTQAPRRCIDETCELESEAKRASILDPISLRDLRWDEVIAKKRYVYYMKKVLLPEVRHLGLIRRMGVLCNG
jgi:hypothetical protein